MRFKPRTDLERIFEVINDYSYGRVSKNPVNEQLRSLELNFMKRGSQPRRDENRSKSIKSGQEIYNEKVLQERLAKEEQDRINSYMTIEVHKKGKEGYVKRKKVDNSAAKKMMKEYHQKTHFKAASVIASKYSTISASNIKTEGEEKPTPRTVAHSHRSSYDKAQTSRIHNDALSSGNSPNNSVIRSKKNLDMMRQISQRFKLDEDNLELVKGNPLMYHLNLNPLQKEVYEEEVDHLKLEYLKNLSEKTVGVRTDNGRHKGVKFLRAIKVAKKRKAAEMNDPLEFFHLYKDHLQFGVEEEVKRGIKLYSLTF